MDIRVADQRILLFPDQITPEEAKEKAWQKKTNGFGAINQVASFLSRPKDDDFELVYSEHRYEPFWHVVAKAHYVYDRTAQYQITPQGPEVESMTLEKTDYVVTNGHMHVSVMEHCRQDEQDEALVDGVSGKNNPNLESYLSITPKVATGNLEKLVPKGAIIVPPQARVSAIMRDALSKMIKGIQADKILEENVEVQCVDLYYRPVYAYQYKWKSKSKTGIVEVDGITGAVASGNRTFSEYLGKVLDRDFLFDIGADAAGMIIPGGNLAVKVAKRYIDKKK